METTSVSVDVKRQISKDICAQELEQLAKLMVEVDYHIKTIDTKLRKIQVYQQKVMALLKHEIDLTYTS